MTSHDASLVIRNARVFDGVEVIDADAVWLNDGLIAEVGTDGSSHLSAAEVVDAGGGTLLPGLIDAHTHALQAADLAQALAFGVTTELDMFCVPSLLGPLREAAATRADLADLRSSGIGATVPGGHPTQLVDMGIYPPFPTVTGPDDADGFVADRVAEGSDYLKVLVDDGASSGWPGIPRLDHETVSALVRAGRAAGLASIAHISTLADALECVAAGVDGLAHIFLDDDADDTFTARAVAAGIFVTPTLTVYEWLYGSGPRREHGYVDRPRLWPYLPAELRGALLADWRDQLPPMPQWARVEHARAATARLHRAGVPILAGTDVAGPRAAHGLSLHAELAALVDAGLSPAEALAAATSRPADAFGLTDRGRIEPGRRADLLLVDGDPTTDIAASVEIAGVWRGGHRFDSDVYLRGLEAGSGQTP